MGAGTYKSFHLPESNPHHRPSKDFHTQHISIELSLDFAKKRVSGSCTLTIQPLREGLNRVQLDACGLEVGRVAIDGAQAEFDYDNERLVVNAKQPLAGSHQIKVDYSTVPREGIYFTEPDNEFPDKEVQAWSHSQAEFARYWFPCYDHPDDKCSSEVKLRVPKGFTVISNGNLVSKSEDATTSTFHWKEDLPHSTYLISFATGKFGEISQEVAGVKLQYYFPESKRTDVMRYFGETPRMIEVFGELTGTKYPYSKYAQTTVQDFIFGGMENFNATTLAMSYYPDASSEEDFQTSYTAPFTNAVNLVAHELAHQWFGDLTTCADWSHAWLNEGFATYLQALYLERTRGADWMRWDLQARAEEYFEEDQTEYRRPIVERAYVFPDDVFDYTTYEKGASMIHELRYVMGEGPFFKGIAAFLKTFAFANVDTHDFLKSMEKASGISLEEFIEQAFFKPGHPEFEVDYSWDEDASTATLKVRQVQKLEDGTPVFKLPCDFVFYIRGQRLSTKVLIDSPVQTLTFKLTAKPTIVELDPQRWLLKKVKFEKGLDLLVNQLEGSHDAWSRAEAAKELGKLKSNRGLPALKAAALKEQFWDVKASALRAMGEIGTEEALEVLLGIGMPEDRRTRRGLAEALGRFKEEKARDLLLRMLKEDVSPYIRCEAALSLAKSWPDGALPHLKEAMGVRSPNETLGEACLDAMGKLDAQQVKEVIKENLPYGRPTRVRIGALRAIKGRGFVFEDEVPVLKEILLHDKEFRVRSFLVSQVVRPLGDKRFLDALRESSRSDRDPRVKRRALETYYELASANESAQAITKLKAEIEELREENRGLAKSMS
ncbi:MAG: M1 family metallopeptidase [Thaumarchaeota archaeon]|nr:M1 family metallopeptidase [Nitrososphaerota archaeon]